MTIVSVMQYDSYVGYGSGDHRFEGTYYDPTGLVGDWQIVSRILSSCKSKVLHREVTRAKP